MDENDKKLIELYKDEIAKFREFCIKHAYQSCFEETDFSGFSDGFFIALGVDNKSGIEPDEPFYDVSSLSRICRYTYLYWESEATIHTEKTS